MRHGRFAMLFVAVAVTAAAPGDDAFDRAIIALTDGVRAADAHDAARLRRAANALRSSAAQPVAGTDIVAQWLHTAGGKPLPPDRDRALGPGYRALDIVGGGAVTFEQTFLAGQMARVAVVPLQRSDFLMRVGEDDRAPLCSASRAKARCDWVPSYTARFRIQLVNPGRAAGRYFLIVQ